MPANIVRQPAGVTRRVNCMTVLDSFALFLTVEMKDIIIRETNRRASQTYIVAFTPSEWRGTCLETIGRC